MLISSCSSFSVVNFMDDFKLLNSLSVCSVFVLFWSYMSILSTYLKYSIICCCFLGSDICVFVPCAAYMFQLILMMLGHPWLTCRFIYSIAGQIGSSFVPSIFSVLFLTGYSCEFLSCSLVYC
jgi:hypothetical protein